MTFLNRVFRETVSRRAQRSIGYIILILTLVTIAQHWFQPIGSDRKDMSLASLLSPSRLFAFHDPLATDGVHGNQTLPDFIIIGVNKGGTRSLIWFLGLHPDIATTPKEVHFFDKNYSRGLEWYRQQMPVSSPGQLTGEKTPAYFRTPDAPARIYKMNPNIKLILIVRHPIIRAISAYAQMVAQVTRVSRSAQPFETLAIDPLTQRVNYNGYANLRESVYHAYFAKWMRYFSDSQMHIVDGDALISNPSSELLKVESFLGLKHFLTPDKFHFNETKGFYCLDESLLKSNESSCLPDNKGRDHPDINPLVLDKLKQFYRPHNLVFYRLAGKDFGW